MKISIYGARGSIPSPSSGDFKTDLFGGNTTCLGIEAGPFRVLLDNGSGVRQYGKDQMKKGNIGKHFLVLISHYHWDHIQGLPFCIPYFIKGNTFHFHGHEPQGHESDRLLTSTVEGLISQQQASPHFPVAHKSLPSTRLYHSHPRLFSESFWYFVQEDGSYEMVVDQAMDRVKQTLPPTIKMDPTRWIKITTIPVNHPDGCLGYRIDYMGKSFAFCTDHEPARYPWEAITRLTSEQRDAKGHVTQTRCDVIYLDGQYTEAQIAKGTQGFGHGTPNACVEQAIAGKIPQVLIGHHDPDHDDAKLVLMEEEASRYAKTVAEYPLEVAFAREGTVVEL